MGNSQPSSPAKIERAGNKHSCKPQQQQPHKEQIGGHPSNYDSQSNKASKRGGNQNKRSFPHNLGNRDKKGDISLTKKVKVLKNEARDTKLVHSVDDSSQQQRKLSGKSGVATGEEPHVFEVGKHIGNKLRTTTPSSLEQDGLDKHYKRQQNYENHGKLLLNSELISKTTSTNLRAVTTTAIVKRETNQGLSANISTSSSLPPLVKLCSHSKTDSYLKEEAESLNSAVMSSIKNAAPSNRKQFGATDDDDEIRVVSKGSKTESKTATAGRIEMGPEKFFTNINSTNLKETTTSGVTVKQAKGGVLSLTKETNVHSSDKKSNLNKWYNDNKAEDDDYEITGPNHNDNHDDKIDNNFEVETVKVSSRSSELQEMDLKERMLFRGSDGLESARLDVANLFDQSNLIKDKNNKDSRGEVSPLPPLVVQRNNINNSVQDNKTSQAFRKNSKQIAFGLSRSFSVNKILAGGASLLNLTSVVAQMKTRASDYNIKRASPAKSSGLSSSTATATTQPTTRMLSAATTRLPMINDNLMMTKATSSGNSLLFTLTSVEDQQQKVKNWLESQPLLTRAPVYASSSSVDQFGGDNIDEEESDGVRNDVRGRNRDVTEEDMSQNEEVSERVG